MHEVAHTVAKQRTCTVHQVRYTMHDRGSAIKGCEPRLSSDPFADSQSAELVVRVRVCVPHIKPKCGLSKC